MNLALVAKMDPSSSPKSMFGTKKKAPESAELEAAHHNPKEDTSKKNLMAEFQKVLFLIQERQEDYAMTLKNAKDYMNKQIKKDRVGAAGGDDFTKTVPVEHEMTAANLDESMQRVTHNTKGVIQTFYDANMFGVSLSSNSSDKRAAYSLDKMRAAIFDVEYLVRNFFGETIYNYKLDATLKVDGCQFSTVFFIPEKLRLNQKKIRLAGLQQELQKLIRGDPMIKEIDIQQETEKHKKYLPFETVQKDNNNFYDDFKYETVNEIGSTSLIITKTNNEAASSSPSDHCTLICPDITNFQLRLIDSVSAFKMADAEYWKAPEASNPFDYFRVYCSENSRNFMVKCLKLQALKKTWNYIFYMLDEYKIYSNHLYHKQKSTNLLLMHDYFLTPAPTGGYTSMYFIYDDYTCTLRDIMNYKKANRQPFEPAEFVRMFLDVMKGVSTLHKLGIVHRNLKPENILYSEKKKLFMVSDLSLAVVCNKEDTLLNCSDLVGTPFYMAIDVFSDLSIEGNRIKFVYDPYKADVYAIGIMMVECCWVNMEIADSNFPSANLVFQQKELNKLEDLLEICETKHKLQTILQEIIRSKENTLLNHNPGKGKNQGGQKPAEKENLKALLENLIFEDSTARPDIYQAKMNLSKLYGQLMSSRGDVSFGWTDLVHNDLVSYGEGLDPDELTRLFKQSSFLKDINMYQKANELDIKIEAKWTQDTQVARQQEYIQFVTSRITNLEKLGRLDDCIQIITEQLQLCKSKLKGLQGDVKYSDYSTLAVQCLIVKGNIMFQRNDVEEFLKTIEECSNYLKKHSKTISRSRENSIAHDQVRLRQNYQEFVMSYYLQNDEECIEKIKSYLLYLKRILKDMQIDPQLVAGSYLVLNSLYRSELEDKAKLEERSKMLKEFEERLSPSIKNNSEILPMIYLFQVYHLCKMGRSRIIEAVEYTNKIAKAVTGNFDDRIAYQMLVKIGATMSSVKSDSDLDIKKLLNLSAMYYEIEGESELTMEVIFFFMNYLLDKYGRCEELKNMIIYEVARHKKLNTAGEGEPIAKQDPQMSQVRMKLQLINLFKKDLQYEKALMCYYTMKPSIAVIEKYCKDHMKIYHLLQLEGLIKFEQGMYFDARKLFEKIRNKIKDAKTSKQIKHDLLYAKILNSNLYWLAKCHLKLRTFEEGISVARELLALCKEKELGEENKLNNYMVVVRMVMSLPCGFSEDISIAEPIRVLQTATDFVQTSNPMKKVEVWYFMAYHFYMKLKKYDRALRFMEKIAARSISTIFPKETTKSYQVDTFIFFHRKYIQFYLKNWELMKNETDPAKAKSIQQTAEGMIRYCQKIVLILSETKIKTDKVNVLKCLITVSKAYLSLGMIDEALANLSKADVILHSVEVSGKFLMQTNVDYMYARIHLNQGHQLHAYNIAKQVVVEYQTFYGGKGYMTDRVYRFMLKACPETAEERDCYEDTKDEEDFVHLLQGNDELKKILGEPELELSGVVSSSKKEGTNYNDFGIGVDFAFPNPEPDD